MRSKSGAWKYTRPGRSIHKSSPLGGKEAASGEVPHTLADTPELRTPRSRREKEAALDRAKAEEAAFAAQATRSAAHATYVDAKTRASRAQFSAAVAKANDDLAAARRAREAADRAANDVRRGVSAPKGPRTPLPRSSACRAAPRLGSRQCPPA